MQLIQETVSQGARRTNVCAHLGISVRSLQRWESNGIRDSRKGAEKAVPRKLSSNEQQAIIETCNSERFKDLNPHQIVPQLAQEGSYLASERTFYRILKSHNQVHHRTDLKPRKNQYKPPELVATAPNEVWCWDITWLPTPVRGLFLYAYMIIDIYDKSIVGWEIHDREDSALARDLFRRLTAKTNLRGVSLHSDNGNPMKGFALLAYLYYLGVVPSFSRPRVSNDNPYIESFFKTVKYTPGYPGRFRNIEHAREWMAAFVHWYNTEHQHSSLGYVTPAQRRSGVAEEIFSRRNHTILKAQTLHPERWGKRAPRSWGAPTEVVLNPANPKESA